ncbi:family 20 glycosylhydrolase [Paenibacillus planticolens]|uniref:Beta-N-acetylhexosaminidase n=1 Tax=Paenibacillus planticolens TaxID=2654976 RepID=A0ABX1ZW70_9BACL|nr:family 20 glycosylhydrolase [Paenibacillus planticolens]NOV03943.1 family 20 glycosylhydrolase [Paenibacillus planticolens]
MKRKTVLALVVVSLLFSLFQLPSVTYAANAAPNVVPSLREWTGGTGAFQLKNTSRIVVDSLSSAELADTAAAFKEDLTLVTGKAVAIVNDNTAKAGDLFLSLKTDDAGIGNEGYVLEAGAFVSIKAHTSGGVFYGTRTVLQILQQDASRSYMPQGVARDYPQYAQRGIMLDVGRRYYSMTYLEDTIKRLAWNKMNTFQIHFSEWNGFRLQSETYPGLASPKSYSRADIQRLTEIADRYHVLIIPELEMPGHAAILNKFNPAMKFSCSSMDKDTTGWSIPQFTVDYTKSETRAWIKSLLDEFVPLFKGPYFHIGSDEIQTEAKMNACPELVTYKTNNGLPKIGDSFIEFINEMSLHVKELGKTPMNWNGFEDYHPSIGLNRGNVITVWSDEGSSSKQAIDFAKEGYKVYASPGNVLYVTAGRSLLPNTTSMYETWNPAVHENIMGYFLSIWSDYWDQVKTPDGRIGYESGSSFKGVEVGEGEYVIPESNFEDASRKPRQVLSERMWGGPRSAKVADFFNRVSLIGDEPSVSNPAPTDPQGMTSIKNDVKGTDVNQIYYSKLGTKSNGSDGWIVGSDSYTSLTDTYFEIKFVGTQVKLIGAKDPAHGIAAVSLDGGSEVDADLYAAARQNTVAWYTSPVLPLGEHTIKVRVAGRKNSASAGFSLSLERAEVMNRTVVENNAVGSGSNQFNYTGAWTIANESISGTTNDEFQLKFTGKQIILIGTKGANQGIAAISIDGGAERMIDMYASASQSGANVFVSQVLSSGPHTIKVRVTGTKNIQSTGTFLTIDRAEIVPADQIVGPVSPETTLSGASSVAAGSEFTVRFGLQNVTQSVYAQDIKLNYDANVMEFVSAKSSKDGISVIQSKDQAGTLRVILASQGAGNAVTGTAEFAEIVFKAKNVQEAAVGLITVAGATLADDKGVEWEVDGSSITVQVTPVPAGIPGDVNGDGRVSIGDLGLAAAHYGETAASPNWQQVKAADINKDGIIDISDMAAIANKILE